MVKIKVKVLPVPMAHREAPISALVALGHMSANAVKATAGGWSTGSSMCLTFPLHSLMLSARQEGSEYHFKSVWYDSAGAQTHVLPVVRRCSTTGPSHQLCCGAWIKFKEFFGAFKYQETFFQEVLFVCFHD